MNTRTAILIVTAISASLATISVDWVFVNIVNYFVDAQNYKNILSISCVVIAIYVFISRFIGVFILVLIKKNIFGYYIQNYVENSTGKNVECYCEIYYNFILNDISFVGIMYYKDENEFVAEWHSVGSMYFSVDHKIEHLSYLYQGTRRVTPQSGKIATGATQHSIPSDSITAHKGIFSDIALQGQGTNRNPQEFDIIKVDFDKSMFRKKNYFIVKMKRLLLLQTLDNQITPPSAASAPR